MSSEVNTIDEQMKTLQNVLIEKTENIQKKYDGLVEQNRVEIAEKISDLQVQFQKVRDQEEIIKKQAESIAKLESAISRGFNPGSGVAQDDPIELKKFSDFVFDEKGGKIQIQKTVRTDDAASAGYVFLPNYSSTIHTALIEGNPIRLLATSISSNSSQEIDLLDDEELVGDLASKWEKNTELGAMTEVDMLKYGEMSWSWTDFTTKTAISKRALRMNSRVNVESRLQEKIARGIRLKEGELFITGSGAGEPRGILSYPAWTTPGAYERGKLEVRKTGVSGGGLTFDILIQFISDFKEDYRRNATFVMNRKVYAQFLLDKSDNNYHLAMSGNSDPGLRPGAQLFRYPVELAENMPVAAADALAVAFGDFKQGYKIVDFGGMTLLRDPITDDRKDIYKVTKSLDAKVSNFDAIKLLKLSV